MPDSVAPIAARPLAITVVVGPTASGKSRLAAHLAARCAGEVVSADAMAVYRGMDIGTAKPSTQELALAPHHVLSVIDPQDHCDVSRWLDLAEAAIRDIHARGKRVIVAGGTPLYTKALVEGLSAGAPRNAELRRALDARYAAIGGAAFHRELQAIDPIYAAAHHANDQRRLVRAVEVFRLTGKPFSAFHTTDGTRRSDLVALHLGVQWDRALLYQRIDARSAAMFSTGLVDEVRRLRPLLSREARQAVGYKEVIAYLDGQISLETALEQVCRASRHLAKHQWTWYRRFPDIHWLPGDAPDLIDQAAALSNAHHHAHQ